MASEQRPPHLDRRPRPPHARGRVPALLRELDGVLGRPKLVIHTNQLMARSMGRNQPEQRELIETVEIWQKAPDAHVVADVWIYDPILYLEPWYLQRRFRRVPNEDKVLRMNYWHCGENPNNDVHKTPEGGTNYTNFTFTGADDRPAAQSK